MSEALRDLRKRFDQVLDEPATDSEWNSFLSETLIPWLVMWYGAKAPMMGGRDVEVDCGQTTKPRPS